MTRDAKTGDAKTGDAKTGDADSPFGRARRSAAPRPAPPRAPRHVAFDVLTAVLGDRQPLDEALARCGEPGRMSDRDRGFSRLLVATALRRLGQIDDVIARLRGPGGALDDAVAHILRLGLAQLHWLNTPPHAAVGEAVELARAVGCGRASGLVNALLRRSAREGAALIGAQDEARLALPDWLWTSWRARYGEPTTRLIARAHLDEPPLDLTLRSGDEAGLWAGRLDATLLPTGSLRRAAGGAIADLPGYAAGAWWIQDAAAAAPVRLLGALAGRRALDLCAAPGGKTLQLAAAGADVTAVDRSPGRLERLAANLRRVGLHARLIAADATLWSPPAPFDLVLLDAPCSATGTIRRHPDIPYLKGPQAVARMTALQDRLLTTAIGALRPGGLMVYCTCSLEAAEGPERIERSLAIDRRIARAPVSAEASGLERDWITPAGELRTLPSHWPERGGVDGFYAAALRRV